MFHSTPFEQTLERILLLVEQQIAAARNGDLDAVERLAELRDAEQCGLCSRSGARATVGAKKLALDIFDAENRLVAILESSRQKISEELMTIRQRSRTKGAYNRQSSPLPRYLDYSL